MKAKELLRRYDRGAMDAANGGMLFDIYFDDLENYVSAIIGKGSEILFGELECHKDYVFAYVEGDEFPEGFGEDDQPAMVVSDGYNWNVWFYEIED